MDKRETLILLLKNGLGWSQEEVDDEDNRNGVLIDFDHDDNRLRNEWLKLMVIESEKDIYPYRLRTNNNDGICSDFWLESKDPDFPRPRVVPGRRYKHFKGGLYLVLHVSTGTEDGERIVVYTSLYGPNAGDILHRTHENFNEIVSRPDFEYEGPRFFPTM